MRYILAVDNKELGGETLCAKTFHDILFNYELDEKEVDYLKKHGIPVKTVRVHPSYWVVDYSKI